MPYLCVKTTAVMDSSQKEMLQKDLGALISVIPGKSVNNCMIEIVSGCDIFMGGGPLKGAFVDLRLYRASPDEAKKEFLTGLCKILKSRFGIEKQNIYCNMLELPQWGSGDNLLG